MDLTNFEDKAPPKKSEAEVKQAVNEIRNDANIQRLQPTMQPQLQAGRWRTVVEVKDGYNSINESAGRPKVEVTGAIVYISANEFDMIVSAENIRTISISQV